MIRIYSAYKRYNANSNDKSVGDCVKRALSFAYGVDYDEISRRLNRIKRDVGAAAFNSYATFENFLKNNNAVEIKDIEDGLTEEEFSQKYNSGVYVLLSGPSSKDYPTHMVCIMNGDIYDSWNSSKYIVRSAWKIPSVSLDVEDVSWEDVESDINSFVEDYLNKVNDKYGSWFRVWRWEEGGYLVNSLTYRMRFVLETASELPYDSEFYYYTNRKFGKTIVVKLNPRMNVEDNLNSLLPKIKERLYNWLYPFEKDMRDTLAIKDMKVHDKFPKDQWTKKSLLRLPAWVRPYVKYLYLDEGNFASKGYYDQFEVSLDALPGDPHVRSLGDKFTLRADTFKELKQKLEDYHEDWTRS